ncbi:hypothetical protein D7X55_03040 [Corallococcus sp. AB049A]|nr:hypothetical protein D7X55_03040 [Corallococcus sp. AB049A]
MVPPTEADASWPARGRRDSDPPLLAACRDNDPPPNVPPVARDVTLDTITPVNDVPCHVPNWSECAKSY